MVIMGCAGCSNRKSSENNSTTESTSTTTLPSVALQPETPTASPPTHIEWSMPATVKTTQCSTAITISTLDSQNHCANASSAISIQLSANSAGAFYSDASCASQSLTAVTLPEGQCQATVYYSGSSLGTIPLTASTTDLGLTTSSIFVVGITKITAGDYHTCALMNDATVWCWGYNFWGQLGTGNTLESSSPVQVPGLSNVSDIGTGFAHTCALINNGTLKCWGRNNEGQLGLGNTTSVSLPTDVTGLSHVTSLGLVTGGYHTCVTINDGTAKCWGYNNLGQVGNGSTSNVNSPTLVNGTDYKVKVVIGNTNTCFLLQNGAIKCVGGGTSGQLGDNNGTNNTSLVTVSGFDGTGGQQANAIYGSWTSFCATRTDNTYWCWGSNGYSMLGDGTGTTRNAPVSIAYGGTIADVSLGGAHKLVAMSDGSLKANGGNRAGQLGLSFVNTSSKSTATTVSGFSNVIKVAAGYEHSCVLLQNGTVKCFGANSQMQLGGGQRSSYLTPVSLALQISNVLAIATSSFHSCFLKTDGTAACAGWNQAYQLGSNALTSSIVPVAVSGLSNANSISAGGNIHTCATLSDGTAKCWGYGASGQIGDGTLNSRNLATPVSLGATPPTTSKIATGNAHSCTALSNYTVKCWGLGSSGQLGNGGTSSSSSPVVVSVIDGSSAALKAMDIVTGYAHSCALISDGTIKCWGLNNYGQIGIGNTTNQNTPVTVSGISTAIKITAGNYHTCAVLSNGNVQCWGQNSTGQIGNNSFTTAKTPVSVSGMSNAVQVQAGSSHTCALLQNGSVTCWGSGLYGQLGNGSSNYYSLTPVTVTNLTGITQLAAGSSSNHTCATKSDGTPYCWGKNESSQMGNSRDFSVVTPIF